MASPGALTAYWDEATCKYFPIQTDPPTGSLTTSLTVFGVPKSTATATTTAIPSLRPRRCRCSILKKVYDGWSLLLFSTVAKTVRAGAWASRKLVAIKQAPANIIYNLTHHPLLPEDRRMIEDTISERLEIVRQNLTAVVKDLIHTNVPAQLRELETLVEKYLDIFYQTNGALLPLPMGSGGTTIVLELIQWDVVLVFSVGILFGAMSMIAMGSLYMCLRSCCSASPYRPHLEAKGWRKTLAVGPSSGIAAEAEVKDIEEHFQQIISFLVYQPTSRHLYIHHQDVTNQQAAQDDLASMASANGHLSDLSLLSPLQRVDRTEAEPSDAVEEEVGQDIQEPLIALSGSHLEETLLGQESLNVQEQISEMPSKDWQSENEESNTEAQDVESQSGRESPATLELIFREPEATEQIETTVPGTPIASESKLEMPTVSESRSSRKRKARKLKAKNKQLGAEMSIKGTQS
ncbi:hypothetical protein ABW21_db0201193 [Orbilia brochopaga]|nr:hypothetical protein ABW21_db0201193 [Drechslerella brochopaga]